MKRLKRLAFAMLLVTVIIAQGTKVSAGWHLLFDFTEWDWCANCSYWSDVCDEECYTVWQGSVNLYVCMGPDSFGGCYYECACYVPA
jgi:hypothetical protein